MRKPRFYAVLLVFSLFGGLGCAISPSGPGGRAPRSMATWNLRQFPSSANTVARVAQIIVDQQLDLVAVQEVADPVSFNELVGQLDGYGGTARGDGPLQVGLIWNSEAFSVEDVTMLYASDNYVFPREPLQARLVRQDTGEDLVVIVVHLKAGFGASDEDRRVQATVRLAPHTEDLVAEGEPEIAVLGDFNEADSDPRSDEVFGPFGDVTPPLNDLTDSLPPGQVTYIPSGVVLDHVFMTPSFAGWVDGGARVPALDDQMIDYESVVSDHLPVVVPLH